MRKIIGFDTETYLIEPGNLTPRLVCLSLAGGEDTLSSAASLAGQLSDCLFRGPTGRAEWELLVGREDALEAFCWAAEHADILACHNLGFDLGVLSKLEPALLDLVFHWLQEGRLRCTMVRETLICIARDWLKYDPRVGPNGLKRDADKARISLWQTVLARFDTDIRGDKANLAKLKTAGVPKRQWPWRLKYDTLDGRPVVDWPPKAISYACEDASWHRRVFISQSDPMRLMEGEVVTANGDVVNEREQTQAAFAMHMMSVEGIIIDQARARKFISEVQAGVLESRAAGAKLGFIRVNACRNCKGTGYIGEVPRLVLCNECKAVPGYEAKPAPKSWSAKDSKRLKALVTHAFGGHPPMTAPSGRYPKGQVKTDSETLLASGNSLLVKYAEGSFMEKLLSTYVPILQSASSGAAINASWNVLVRSGRTSCSSPNWQNPPQRGGFRECVVARPGKVLCSCDYTGQEMVTLAQCLIDLFGEEPGFRCHMAEAINADEDLHVRFAAQMLGTSYEDLLSRYKSGDPAAVEMRQRAKPGNFGFPGGLGPETFVAYAKGYGIDLAKLDPNGDAAQAAKALKAAWMDTWPEMQRYFALISSACERSTDGRFNLVQLPTRRIRGGCTYTSGANSYFQGRGADATKAAMWNTAMECYTGYSTLWPRDGRQASPLFGCRQLAMIHDELIVEGDETKAHLWAPRLREAMVDSMRPYTPDVRVKAEEALMPRWFKKAERVTVGGKLVPWYPGLKKAKGEVSESLWLEAKREYERSNDA
jgi:hypothetical protein